MDAKLGFSTKDPVRRLAGGLEFSNFRGNFKGLPEIFTLLVEERILLGQEDQEQAKQLAQIRPAPLPRYLKSAPLALMLLRSEMCHHDTFAHWCLWQFNKTTQSQQARRSITTIPAHADSTILQGAQTGLDVMISVMAKNSDSIVKPDSEKQLKQKMQQTKLHARHLVQVEVTVHYPFLKITNAMNMCQKMN